MASGSAGLQMYTFAPSTPRNAWQAPVSSGCRRPPPPDRALAVPHQRLRDRAELLGQQLPPAGVQVLAPRGTGSAPRPPTGSTRTPSSSPAAASPCGTARTRPAARCREPEVELRQLARPRTSCARPGPAAGTPAAARATRSLEHRQSERVPPDPLGDHRGRHRRHTPAAAHGSAARTRRPPTPPASARTSAARPRPAPCAPCSSSMPNVLRDHLDRHPLGPVQPTDLCPVLH